MIREGFWKEVIFKLRRKEPVMRRIGQQLSRQRQRQVQRSGNGDRKAIGLSEEQKGGHLMCAAHFGAPWDWVGGSSGRAGSHRVAWAMVKSWAFIQLWESERTAQPQYPDGTLSELHGPGAFGDPRLRPLVLSRVS